MLALQRPASNAPDANATGNVNFKKKGVEAEFEAEGDHLDSDNGAAYGVFMETGVGTGAVTQKNSNDHGKLSQPVASQPSPKAKGLVIVKTNAKKGTALFEVNAAKLAPSNTYDLFIETSPGSGIFTNAGSMTVKGNKMLNALYRRDSKKGDALPLGAATVQDLSNRKIEIRDGAGVTHLTGLIP